MAINTIHMSMAQLIDHFSKCVFFSASVLSRALARMACEHFAAFDLSATQRFILIALRKAPGITASDLGAVLFLDQSTVAKTIDRMILKGLVQREPVGRSVRIFLTGKGEVKEVEAKSAWTKTRQAYGKAIGEPESKLLSADATKARLKLIAESTPGTEPVCMELPAT
jgi:DNA-binding MarR family transcriptional regulator